MKKTNKEITIKDIWDLFLPKIWIMLLVGILFAGAVSIHSIFVKKDYYTCSTLVYVQKDSTGSTISTDIDVAEQMVAIFKIAIYDADLILDEIAGVYSTEYGLTSGSIRSMMSVEQKDETPFLEIKVTHTNPSVAFNVAKELAHRSPNIPEKLEATGLKVTVIDYPIKPEYPNSKNTVRNAIIAFLAGVVASMAVIWVISIFDTVIRGRKKIEDNFDIPVLAVIPVHEIAAPKEGEVQK